MDLKVLAIVIIIHSLGFPIYFSLMLIFMNIVLFLIIQLQILDQQNNIEKIWLNQGNVLIKGSQLHIYSIF